MAEPTIEPPPPPPTGLFGLTKAQWQLVWIGVLFLVPPLVFVIVILAINLSR